MKISFLGTCSGVPTKERNVSCISLLLDSGDIYLIDCGEATQHQIQKSQDVKMGKITNIFITHLHGDHIFGLPGLCCSISNQNPPDRTHINIYGPLGIRKFIYNSLALSDSHPGLKFNVFELVPPEHCNNEKFLNDYLASFGSNDVNVHLGYGGGEGDDGAAPMDIGQIITGQFIKFDEKAQCYQVMQKTGIKVQAAPIKHRVFTVGYVFTEDNIPGKLDVEKVKKLGIKQGPLFGKLKNGQDVQLEDGTIIKAKDVVGDEQPGRKVCILGDTHDPAGIAHIAKDCDVLTHESTLDNEQQALAVERGHSCPKLAATFAKSINCKLLILTHFSARFEKEDKQQQQQQDSKHKAVSVALLKQQAQLEFQTVELADDFKTFAVERPKAKLPQ